MGSEAVECTTCGAVMVPQTDGRTYACEYCSAQILVAVEGAQIAQGMALDLSNATAFLFKLAHALESAVADRTKVQRRGNEVMAIELDLAPNVFLAKHDGRSVVAQHKKVVRGIALKTSTHPLDRWVEMLTDALAAHANENTRASDALKQLFGRR
ncbi:MAG: hypothetical protein ACXWUG_10180 [Polyangiales bacterium]